LAHRHGKRDSTAQLNQQELARHRSVASPPDNPAFPLIKKNAPSKSL
jgi:hypothetical protein